MLPDASSQWHARAWSLTSPTIPLPVLGTGSISHQSDWILPVPPDESATIFVRASPPVLLHHLLRVTVASAIACAVVVVRGFRSGVRTWIAAFVPILPPAHRIGGVYRRSDRVLRGLCSGSGTLPAFLYRSTDYPSCCSFGAAENTGACSGRARACSRARRRNCRARVGSFHLHPPPRRNCSTSSWYGAGAGYGSCFVETRGRHWRGCGCAAVPDRPRTPLRLPHRNYIHRFRFWCLHLC
mmetsp:Transcript_12799/g.15614  ORF Transcript_12799/g.15614 Transcript_12799/m.15614 type:complete len:240 (-) Transcript_12799:111-830(-)